jgi:hypothetical protein
VNVVRKTVKVVAWLAAAYLVLGIGEIMVKIALNPGNSSSTYSTPSCGSSDRGYSDSCPDFPVDIAFETAASDYEAELARSYADEIYGEAGE